MVRQLRVEAAQRMIERSKKGLEPIAMACGFSSAALMRRAFIRTLGTTPRTSLSRNKNDNVILRDWKMVLNGG